MTEMKWGGEPLPGLELLHVGKVRNSYANVDDDPRLRLVQASNRISVFDFVLNAEVKDKGAVLTAMNLFWRLDPLKDVCEHDLAFYGKGIDPHLPPELRGNLDIRKNTVVVRSAAVYPFEAIVRGNLTGTGFAAYRETDPHTVCGHVLPGGLTDGDELQEPIFTPTTKAEVGHDEHVTFESVREHYGPAVEALVLRLFLRGRTFARSRGIVLADTKYEIGVIDGRLVLCDEVLTPDSSRYWKWNQWFAAVQQGVTPPPYDKQFVRNWAKQVGIDKRDPKNPDDYAWVRAQVVPQEILDQTSNLYRQIFYLLVGMTLEEFQERHMHIVQ